MALDVDPRNLHALAGQQKLHEEQRQWREAYEIQTRLARMRKSDDGLVLGFLQVEMGREARRAGRADAAEEAFRTALSLDRRVFPAHLALADVLLERDPRRAAQVLEDAIAAAPERAYLAFAALQGAYAAMGAPSRFAALCERLVGQDPRDWRARLALARQLRDGGRAEEALGLLLRALEANPHVLLVHLEVWRTLRALGTLGPDEQRYVADRRGIGPLRGPAHLHGLPLPRRRHAVALPSLPRVEHLRGGAGRAGGGAPVRGRSAFALIAGAGILAAIVLRPLAHGVPGVTLLVFWATVLGQAVVPGVLLCRGARLCAPGDAWLTVGQGSTLGLSIQGLALLAGRALGAHWLPTLAAVVAAGAGLALERSAPRRGAGGAPRASALTLAVALAAVLLQPLASTGRLGEPVPFDLLFHAGIAGEVRHRWPLEDPRVAGVPLHYHLLAFALPVEAADRAGAPVADPLLALAPLFWVGLLALQVSNAGRVVFRDGRAGALGAAVALLHTDPGQFLGLGPGAFNSHLATGIFGSPTTVCGLVLLAGLTVSLESWVEAGGRRHLAATALLAAAASGAKTTVLPVVLGGLALAAGRALILRNPIALRRWVAAFVVAAAAGAPLTLWQTSGDASYSGMARFGPWTAFSSSGFASACARWMGPGATNGPAAAAALALWLVGYLGLAGVAAASWLARREGRLRETQAWALALFAVGLAATLLLDVPGLSQLFLLYNGQLLLCLFAGAGLARAARWPRGPLEAATAVLLALAALPVVRHVARALPAGLQADAAAAASTASPMARDYGEGLAWLRDRASQDAVVFADNPSLLLSAFGEIRLYYETWPLHRPGVADGTLARAMAGAVRPAGAPAQEAGRGGRGGGPARRRPGSAAPGRRRCRGLARRVGLRARLSWPGAATAALSRGPVRAALREPRAPRLRGPRDRVVVTRTRRAQEEPERIAASAACSSPARGESSTGARARRAPRPASGSPPRRAHLGARPGRVARTRADGGPHRGEAARKAAPPPKRVASRSTRSRRRLDVAGAPAARATSCATSASDARVRTRGRVRVGEPGDRARDPGEERRVGGPAAQRPGGEGNGEVGRGGTGLRFLRRLVPGPCGRRRESAGEPFHLQASRLGGDGEEGGRGQPAGSLLGAVHDAPEKRSDGDGTRIPPCARERAELRGQRVRGAIRVVDRTRRVHLEVGESALLGERHLRLDARQGGPLVETVPGAEATQLLAGVAVHDHEPVEPKVHPGLDEESGVGHQHRRSPPGEVRGPTGLLGAHAGVDDGVQPRAGRGVREHHRRERDAVQRAVGAHDPGAEDLRDLAEGGAARRGHVPRDGVQVERVEAVAGEPPQDVGLAAGDAAGQADPQQALRRRRAAARTVFESSIAMVSGPTPPGTGVSAPATGTTDGACTSPTRACPFFSSSARREGRSSSRAVAPSLTRFMPTSTTTAPGLTCSARTRPAFPIAATRMSASRVTAARSRVREWQTVTVASACIRRSAMGFPTMSLRPSTTALRPATSIPLRLSISMIPAGVHGTKHGRFCTSRPTLAGWKPSTSFSGATRSRTRVGVDLRGQRRLHQDPVDVGPGGCSRRPPRAPPPVVALAGRRRVSRKHARAPRTPRVLLRT